MCLDNVIMGKSAVFVYKCRKKWEEMERNKNTLSMPVVGVPGELISVMRPRAADRAFCWYEYIHLKTILQSNSFDYSYIYVDEI